MTQPPTCSPVLGLLAALAILAGPHAWCDADATSEPAAGGQGQLLRSSPLVATQPSTSKALFQRVTAERSGVAFVTKWDPPRKYASMIDRSFAGGGVALGDYNADGMTDVYLTRPFGGGRLFQNKGDFQFDDATRSSGLSADTGWTSGAAFADVDGDSDLDLFVCGYDCPNRMFINQGDGTFIDRAKQLGLDFRGASVMVAFADYDNDGDLDAFLVTNRFSQDSPAADSSPATMRMVKSKLVRRKGTLAFPEDLQELFDVIRGPGGMGKIIKAGQYARLYRNDGPSGFQEVAKQAGIVDNGMSLAASWWDYDSDGWPDLYLANDFFGADRLYRNNRDGTFTDVIASRLPHTPWFSMGVDAADIDNDGRLDLLATDMSGSTHYNQHVGKGEMLDTAWFLDTAQPRQYMRNALYLNQGRGVFLEAANLCGMANTDWTWSPVFGDFDNDGRIDLSVTNGMTGDYFNSDLRTRVGHNKSISADQTTEKRDRNLLYRNLGDLRFEEVGEAWGFGEQSVSFGSAVGDLDGDGDLDLVVNNFNEPVGLYRNTSPAGNRAVVELEGSTSNSHGLGATVRITTPAGSQVRYLTSAHGFMGSSQPQAHFGLGEQEAIERIEVTWPGGHRSTFSHPPINSRLVVSEGTRKKQAEVAHEAQPTLFIADKRLGDIQHQESPFDDFEQQPLLPHRLSQFGPCLTTADVNGDGRGDLYLGGSAGRGGELYVQTDDGFKLAGVLSEIDALFDSAPEPFQSHADSEDTAAHFFDADGDGDRDLYVVSGGVECLPGDAALRDRLYLNDGAGTFSHATTALPDLRDSGGCVASGDFDRDGDLDLFVGGRSVPGEYPTAAKSRLLLNNGGKFVVAPDSVASSLQDCGIATGAAWADVDADGWTDLVVACDWGPVRVFKNNKGRLTDATAAAGLATRLGWWTSLTPCDLDNDSDTDFVVTNFGLNTKYQATADTPLVLLYGDMDRSGSRHLVEAKTAPDGSLLPQRGKHAVQVVLPAAVARTPTFHDYALARLGDIYPAESLDKAMRLTCNCLESGVLLNDGRGRFDFHPLPRVAQAAPSFGSTVLDYDRDGVVDIYLTHNFYGPHRETGRMDGGVGALLKGRRNGGFVPIGSTESGLVVAADARGAVACDIDHDGHEDLIIGVNNGPLHGFRRTHDRQPESASHRVRP